MSPLRKTTPFAFVRRIRSKRRSRSRCETDPGLPAREIGEHLQAGREQAKLRGHLELPLEPLPLPLAEHRRLRVGIARIRPRHVEALREPRPHPGLEVGAAEVLRHERRPVVTKVRQDHLHAPARRSEDIGGIDAVAVTARRVGGLTPEIEEDAAGLLLHRIFATRIVLAVIVVVPDRDERLSRRAGAQSRAAPRAPRTFRGAPTCRACPHRCCRRGIRTGRACARGPRPRSAAACSIRRRIQIRFASKSARAPRADRSRMPRRSARPHPSQAADGRPGRQHRRRPATGEVVPAARDRDRPGSWRVLQLVPARTGFLGNGLR